MWGRLRRARISRQSQVRLQVRRRDPIERSFAGGPMQRLPAPESRGLSSGIQRLGRMLRRLARNGVAQYWRVRARSAPRKLR
jgi:hypothetical protein